LYTYSVGCVAAIAAVSKPTGIMSILVKERILLSGGIDTFVLNHRWMNKHDPSRSIQQMERDNAQEISGQIQGTERAL
jgi:hypothetical protein